jgi:hypothetical protein
MTDWPRAPRRLTENREPTADKPDWVRHPRNFPILFVKYVQYSPQTIEKSDSIMLVLATAPILGQPPSHPCVVVQ